ncbi:MAG: thymidine kinase [Acetobacteraceae bacterium]|nr:thymidine kinase [Acetobacteraceae bacterium]
MAFKGSLVVIAGCMFAGKSEELIRLVKRAAIARQRTLVFKPSLDDRYDREEVVSHDGVGVKAIPIDPHQPQAILERVDSLTQPVQVVALDEGQFFSPAILDVVQDLVGRGVRVIVAGLDTDFAGRPFGPMPQLMALADEVMKLKAICVRCGQPAFHTQRLIDGRPAPLDSPLILIGGSETYEARCRDCWEMGSPEQRPQPSQA